MLGESWKLNTHQGQRARWNKYCWTVQAEKVDEDRRGQTLGRESAVAPYACGHVASEVGQEYGDGALEDVKKRLGKRAGQ